MKDTYLPDQHFHDSPVSRASSFETFRAEYMNRLTEVGTLLVPDLLGFSRSMDFDREQFALGDHLDALDEMMTVLDLSDARFVGGGHFVWRFAGAALGGTPGRADERGG